MEKILKEKNYKSFIQSGMHGEQFQEDVAHVILLRMRENSQHALGYEVTAAGKFDDIVLIDDEKGAIHFIQVKHGNAKTASVPVGLEALFPTQQKNERRNGDFDLLKYLRSHIEIYNNSKTSTYEKKFYIVSNRRLQIPDDKWLTINKQNNADKMLQFSGSKDPPFKLIPTQKTIEKLCHQTNKDIIEVKDSIKKLFSTGEVNEILNEYRTPLKEVLQIRKHKKCSFLESFRSNQPVTQTLSKRQMKKEIKKKRDPSSKNINQSNVSILHDMLKNDQFDLTQEKEIEKNFLVKNSRQKCFSYVSEQDVKAFFNDLTLLVGQPDDIRPVIEKELQKWLRTWILSDMLGKMAKKDVDHIYHHLVNSFRKWNKPNETKKFLEPVLIQDWLETYKNDNKDFFNRGVINNLEKFYINRQIKFQESGVSSSTDAAPDPTNDRLIDDSQFVKDLRILFEDQPCILLLADPGVGKTSLLKFFAFEIQNQYDCNVFLVYFSSFVAMLDKLNTIANINDVVSLLENVLSEENCDIIRNAPDQQGARNILLVMDGFNEIHAKYTEKVIGMLKILQNKKSIQMIISSRKHTKSILEGNLNGRSMFLEPFSQKERIEYLSKTWNISQGTEQKFMKYSEILLKTFHSRFCSNSCDMSGLPLMMKTLAEIQRKDFENTVGNFSSIELDVVQFYKQFILDCFIIKLMEKTGCNFYDDDDMYSLSRGYITEHQLLAIKRIGIELHDKFFDTFPHKEDYDRIWSRCEKGSEKSLMVKLIEDDVAAFQLLCCEYLVAKYLNDNDSFLKENHVERFLSDHYVVRELLDKHQLVSGKLDDLY